MKIVKGILGLPALVTRIWGRSFESTAAGSALGPTVCSKHENAKLYHNLNVKTISLVTGLDAAQRENDHSGTSLTGDSAEAQSNVPATRA
jgi:hypothetical protein